MIKNSVKRTRSLWFCNFRWRNPSEPLSVYYHGTAGVFFLGQLLECIPLELVTIYWFLLHRFLSYVRKMKCIVLGIPSLFVLVNYVFGSFTSCQINKRQFTEHLLPTLLLQTYLQNGMWSRWVQVGTSCPNDPHRVPEVYELHDCLNAFHLFLLESYDVDFLFSVFPAEELLTIVE